MKEVKGVMMWLAAILLLVALILYMKGGIDESFSGDVRRPGSVESPDFIGTIQPKKPSIMQLKQELEKAVKEGRAVIHRQDLIEVNGCLCSKQFGIWKCINIQQ